MGRDGQQTVRLHQGQLREGEEARSRHQGPPGRMTGSTTATSPNRRHTTFQITQPIPEGTQQG